MNGKGFLLPLCILMALTVTGCGGKKEESAVKAASMEQIYAEKGIPVTVREMAYEDFSAYRKYPTVLYARSESTAYASISDVVRSINVKVGDRVVQDQVILSLSQDNQTYQHARLSYENARSTYDRSLVLFGNGDISRQDFDNAKMQYDLARTNLDAAADMINIKAPIGGTITQLNVHTTANVRPGSPLFTVSNRNGYEGRFFVEANEIDLIKNGERVFIYKDGDTIEGRITQVSLVMDVTKQAFPVTAFFDVQSRKLVSGMGADLSVETYRNEHALVVERKELIRDANGYKAYVALDGKARPVQVRLGQEHGLSFEVLGGLNEGDLLITQGNQRVSPDVTLNIVQKNTIKAE
ncbi:efflux RND transporter periplasmic adaptor subunit [Brucepastera parasyntrophica]|uniref:efflux RND transporter periplasmic adaptor subunit n=1 Tax=Brucepastera parasyntrophica TaxID=2880008 RepID=UPI00210B1582|nr:efflux RND transporter periplasmic adaptor subunit [Brucepastera parasyntrophica]ULQ58568.1 efflux RND transporter periplasmic adaptor subunit [Brucepastera parasyntrophica]